MKIRVAIALALFLAPPAAHAFVFCEDGAAREAFQIGLASWEKALEEKRYADLDAHFNALLDSHEAGNISDALVKRAFAVFENADAGHEPRHFDWIRESPRSRAAYLALGYHYTARAFAAQGTQHSEAISRVQQAAMDEEARKALIAFGDADKLAKKPTLSIASRIRLAAAHPGSHGVKPGTLYRDAIKTFPDTLEVRIQYIKASHPKRGGSMKQLASIGEDAKSMPPEDYRYVQYLVYQEMASVQETAKNDRAAVDLYEKSVALCPGLDASLVRLGQVHARMKDHASVIAAMGTLIERYPRNGWAHSMRGDAYRETGKFARSFVDYQRAAELGYGPGFEGLAWFHETGTLVPKDVGKAVDLYMTAYARNVEGAKAKADNLRASLGAKAR
jgi:tetratricopeptide (TPR) repeat protein